VSSASPSLPGRRLLAACLPALLVLSACGGDGSGPEPVASVTVTSPVTTLEVGMTTQLTATARNAAGDALTGREVNWSSSAESVATVSSTGLVTAVGTGTAQITATIDGRSGSVSLTVLAADACQPGAGAAINLAVGQQLILRDASQHCLQFAASNTNEAYLIGVQSVSEVPGQLTPVRVQGVTAAAAAAAGASFGRMLPPEPRSRATTPSRVPVPSDRLASPPPRHREAKLRIRAWEQQYVAPRFRELRASALAVAAEPPALASPDWQVGQTVEIRVPDGTPGRDLCRDFIPIQTTVRLIGQRGIWLEDQANPPNGFTEDDFQAMSAFFDTQVYTTITNYFGAPTDLDQNERIIIVATKEVNRAGPAGFVVSTDFFTREQCPSSNRGEIYYSEVPDPNGTVGNARPKESVIAFSRIVIPHEITHIIQFGRRIVLTPGAQSLMSLWEAEGQATLAEEIMGHAQTGRQPRQNYGANVIFPPEGQTPWYLNAFGSLVTYYGFLDRDVKAPNAPEQCTWLALPAQQPGAPCASGTIYGPPWSLLRWLSDHHGARFPGGESGLHQALIQNRFAGFVTIEEVIGQPVDRLLAQWAAMLYVDDRVPGAQAELTLPSWNLFDFEGAIVPAAHLQPRQRGFTNFSDDVSVRAASTAYFRVSAPNRPATAIRVRDQAGAPLPAIMQVWIVRLQ
jgi:hypothetical protein